MLGLGEKFSPDLHTGTGNFTIPIALPAGRSAFQPELNLAYSTGHGNGLFGLGWSLSVPGVSRKTAKGVPRYDDRQDVFILSGSEDLVRVAGEYPGRVRYRPRTEGLFALIEHVQSGRDNYWEVRTKDGLTSRYGTPRPTSAPAAWADPAVTRKDARADAPVFAWHLTLTRDSFGNLIQYRYDLRDADQDGPHTWDQPLLTQVAYADHGDPADPQFLVRVRFIYEDEPRGDAFSDHRAGFDRRTTRRCERIRIETHADAARPVREYRFAYGSDPANGVSLLSEVTVVGFDDAGQPEQELPPLAFGYTRFEPATRRTFGPLIGTDLPARSLASTDLELVDLFGQGLPDILEMNGTVRYWRNRGDGTFDPPRPMRDAPGGLSLADTGVQLVDADGDGRADLLVTTPGLAGYFPLRFGGLWDRKSFRSYQQAPGFSLEDPEVRLLDLDGDGVTDAIRSGAALECFFSDPHLGWHEARRVERRALEAFPDVSFADPRVRWADMSGDGLQDLVLLHDGNVEYWPNHGRGEWGKRVHMRRSPRFPYGYDAKRVLLGDVDGDGLADLVYVDDRCVHLWINQSGNGWSEAPVIIRGTPPVSDTDAVRLVDIRGTGIGGVLWSMDAAGSSRKNLWFLDFTGGAKPYLLDTMDNHLGALTRIRYAPSTEFFLADQRDPKARWRTPLPFPVHVVRRVEVVDELARGMLVTEYRYHHGYWDGAEREFRGFGMVEQLDTQTFERYSAPGGHPAAGLAAVPERHFSPPTLLKTWFHLGPVGDEFGDWEELDCAGEYWSGDGQLLDHESGVGAFLAGFPQTPSARRAKRDALRTLRGSILRTELYALDGPPRQDRPYTVTEAAYGLVAIASPEERPIFFAFPRARRTTQWERGDDPLTRLTFMDDHDEFGQPRCETAIGCPRGWRSLADRSDAYLATRTRTAYARPRDLERTYLVGRVARKTTFEIGFAAPRAVPDVVQLGDGAPELAVVGQSLHFYDGEAFVGLPNGQVGAYGALVRTENLALTEDILGRAYGVARPPYLASPDTVAWPADYPQPFRDTLVDRAGYIRRGADGVFAEGLFIAEERRSYDFHEPGRRCRGLVTAIRPPLGQGAERDTRVAYDAYDLLLADVTDSLALVTRAEYSYRALRPARVVDANGNWAEFTYSPLGLLATVRVRGKAGEGDQAPDRPSLALSYDGRAFELRGQPISVRSVRRVHHAADLDVPLPERDQTIESREYSDGFGRLLQTRTQAEDVLFGDERFGGGVVPAAQTELIGAIVGRQRAADAPPNVVVSGWQVYDNKGRVVERFEPFFGQGWEYAPPAAEPPGAKVTMSYDPRGHVVRTVNPDGSEQRIIFGAPTQLDQPDVYEPTPWEASTYDANDNAGRTHGAAARAYEHHWNTPTSIVVDGLGRTVETVERNRATLADPVEAVRTRMTYDIRGNLLTVTDALGRPAFQHIYDLANRKLQLDSIDAGVRLVVPDAAGNVIEQRDAKGALILHAYDVLNRPTRLWARDGAIGPVTARERLEYGDGGAPSQPPAERAAQQQANRLGKLHRRYDEAGLMTYERYDFKGSLLDKTRRVVKDAVLTPGWTANWDTPAPDSELDPTAYQTTTAYDALNRIKAIRYPRDVSGARKELQPEYNRAGALQGVRLDGEVYVRRIAYNARGQRTLVAYGNGMLTGHAYNPLTFRLQRLWTGHVTMPAGTEFTYHPASPDQPLQDFGYDYDLAGNIWAIRDRAPGCGLPARPDLLDRAFVYDALYRLRSATGRECNTPAPAAPWDGAFRCHDVTVARAYSETYRYDAVGNITQLNHSAGVGSFTRAFSLVPDTSRLQEVRVGLTPYAYQYDANGNMTGETTSRHFDWDHSDRMKGYRTQPAGGSPSLQSQYLYDTSGQRVKKLVRKQGGQAEVTVYIDGLFERHLRGALQNDILQVMDNHRRIALVRVGPAFPDDGAADKPVQYHLGDHLGSSHIVVGGATATNRDFVNREEYTPYGETSFGSFGRKRFRFTGKERDEESGLNYHEARYYAPWIGRWTSCDPLWGQDGTNPHTYVRNNPLNAVDRSGLETDPVPTRAEEEAQMSSVKLHSVASGAPPPPQLGAQYSDKNHPPPKVGNVVGAKQPTTHPDYPTIQTIQFEQLNTEKPKFDDRTLIDPSEPIAELKNPARTQSTRLPGHPEAVNVQQRLHNDYPGVFPPREYYTPVNVPPLQLNGAFIIVGKGVHMGSKAAGGYITAGVNEHKGVYGGVIVESGLALGPAEVTEGFELGAGTKSGGFMSPAGFATIGTDSGFGVGVAWELERDKPLPFTGRTGEVAPFVYFPVYGVTVGIGVDVSYDKSRF